MERQILSDITYMWSVKKYNDLVNITKKKQTHRYSGYQWWRRDNIRTGEWEVQTIGCKIGSRRYCTIWEIKYIFCNNCKWKVTFKNCVIPNFFWTSLEYIQWMEVCLPMLGHGFNLWSGKIQYIAEQLSPCSTTTEPVCCNY